MKAIGHKNGMASAVASAIYTINLPAGVSISISPATANLLAGQTQGITPTVTGSSNLGVN